MTYRTSMGRLDIPNVLVWLAVVGVVLTVLGIAVVMYGCSGLYNCPAGGCTELPVCANPGTGRVGIVLGAAGVDMVGFALLQARWVARHPQSSYRPDMIRAAFWGIVLVGTALVLLVIFLMFY